MKDETVIVKVYMPRSLKEALRRVASKRESDLSSLLRALAEAYMRGDCVCAFKE